jgi:hypothetical protein
MKNYIKHKLSGIFLKTGILAFVLLTACDKGFEEMNKNPNAYTEPVIANLFTTSLIRGAGTGTADRIEPILSILPG